MTPEERYVEFLQKTAEDAPRAKNGLKIMEEPELDCETPPAFSTEVMERARQNRAGITASALTHQFREPIKKLLAGSDAKVETRSLALGSDGAPKVAHVKNESLHDQWARLGFK